MDSFPAGILALLLLIATGLSISAQEKIIFDTDFGGDQVLLESGPDEYSAYTGTVVASHIESLMLSKTKP